MKNASRYRQADGQPQPFNISPLWRLHRLNIIDKHRLLLVIASVFGWDELWWGWNDEWGTSPIVRLAVDPLEDGSPTAWFNFQGNERPDGFDPHASLRVSLYEPEMPDLADKPIDQALDMFAQWVEWSILRLRFAPLFP